MEKNKKLTDRPLNPDHVKQLFRTKSGPVEGKVIGPRIGFRWRIIEYCRWRPSTRVPGGWDKYMSFRHSDHVHLEKCVKEVGKWLREVDEPPRKRD